MDAMKFVSEINTEKPVKQQVIVESAKQDTTKSIKKGKKVKTPIDKKKI